MLYYKRVKLLLVDGHYYVYRSYFAILHLSNSRGEPTNAIFGFTKSLRLMLKHLQPDLAAVVWDRGLPQRRTELQPGYKETRKEMPPPMMPQIDYIEKLMPALGFKNVSLPDTEADDVMGCYAIKARERGMEVVLATNDKDLFQLVDSNVKIYTTAKADLASPKDAFALLGEKEVTAKWEVPPPMIGDVLAIAGDAVDNIRGVGIGRKAAAKLLRDFGERHSFRCESSQALNIFSRPGRCGGVRSTQSIQIEIRRSHHRLRTQVGLQICIEHMLDVTGGFGGIHCVAESMNRGLMVPQYGSMPSW